MLIITIFAAAVGDSADSAKEYESAGVEGKVVNLISPLELAVMVAPEIRSLQETAPQESNLL